MSNNFLCLQSDGDNNKREKKKRKSSESMRRLLRAFGIDPTPFKTRNDLKHAVIIAQKSENTKRASQKAAETAASEAAAEAEAAATAKSHKPPEVAHAAKRSRPVTDVRSRPLHNHALRSNMFTQLTASLACATLVRLYASVTLSPSHAQFITVFT